MRLYILLFFILTGCTLPNNDKKLDSHFEMLINGQIVICETITYFTYGVTLSECKLLESNKKIHDINQAVNFLKIDKGSY